MGHPKLPEGCERASSGIFRARVPRVSAALLEAIDRLAVRTDSGDLALASAHLGVVDGAGIPAGTALALRWVSEQLVTAAEDLEALPSGMRSYVDSIDDATRLLVMLVAELKRTTASNDAET